MLRGTNTEEQEQTMAGRMICVGMLAFVCWIPVHATEQVATVTVPAQIREISRDVMGTVVAERRTALAFEVAGRVVSRPLEMGVAVSEGDTIVRLDARAVEARVDLALANLARAEADLELQSAQYRRFADNHARAAISDADLDVAQANLARARATRKQARAELDLARVDLDRHTLVAPFTGVLTARMPETGNYVTPGAPLGFLVSVDRRARAQVTSSELRRLRAGRYFLRPRDRTEPLEVIATSPLAAVDSGLHAVDLTVPDTVDAQPGELLPLQVVDRARFPHIDRALRRDGDGAFVWVVHDGVARRAAWPDGTGNLAGASVVVMGGDGLADGVAVAAVPLDAR